MAVPVEVFGPPAVGKTTIVKAVGAFRHRGAAWTTEDILLMQAPRPKNVTQAIKSTAYRMMRKRQPIHDSVAERFIDHYPEFQKICWELIDRHLCHDDANRDSRFRRSSYFYEVFACIQRITEDDDASFCLITEGLCQRFLSCISPTLKVSDARRYVWSMPYMPCAIFVDAPTEEIFTRTMSRAPRMTYWGMDQEHIRSYIDKCRKWSAHFADLLEERGTTIHRFDATIDVKKNASRLADILHSRVTRLDADTPSRFRPSSQLSQ